MDDKRLEEIVAELSESLEEEDPCCQISNWHPHYLFITANRTGLLSLANSFLSAALRPPSKGAFRTPGHLIEHPLRQIREDEHDFKIASIQHESVFPVPEEVNRDRNQAGSKSNLLELIVWAAIAIIFVGLIITGLITWVRFFWGST